MAATSTNDQIRRLVLETLYEDQQKNPENLGLWRSDLKEKLKLPDSQVSACIHYLEQKGLITVKRNCIYAIQIAEETKRETGSERSSCTHVLDDALKITALGIDVVERKDKFAKKFPFLHVTIENISGTVQKIGGNVYGSVTAVQGDSNIVSISQQITDAFQQAYDKVRDAELQPEQKEVINGQLKDLEQELQKEDKAEVGKIQKISHWLKNNANWITPILADVVKKGIEKACGF